MSESMNPKTNSNETVKENAAYQKLTTQSLGIADAKARTIEGIELSPAEIKTAVSKVFQAIGVNEQDIRGTIVMSDNNNVPHIIVDVKLSALTRRNTNNSNTSNVSKSITSTIISNHDDNIHESDNQYNTLAQYVYNSLHNKIYHGKCKHLRYTVVNEKSKHDDRPKKYARIEIDPMIFIAFVYDINFCDPMFKISASPSFIKYKGLSDKEKAYYDRVSRENKGMKPCGIYATYRKTATWNVEGKPVSGFHPAQVDDWYALQDREDNNNNRKKNNR